MGFSTGEIIWWEPMSQRYTRLNKNVGADIADVANQAVETDPPQGIINGTPVSEIRWIPGSENLFLAAHMDGSLVVYDKEKEDAAFSAEDEGASRASGESIATGRANYSSQIQVNKSVHSKNQKTNPVAVWKLSNQRINAFAFSPDNRHLAVVSEDGSLRIIDYLKEEYADPLTPIHPTTDNNNNNNSSSSSKQSGSGRSSAQSTAIDKRNRSERNSSTRNRSSATDVRCNPRLIDLFYSYYGGLTCVCWSPDGKYVVTGGQDDLVSIWCPSESPALIARCQGHHSWVTSVAFDPWRCDEKSYRFGSVGEDCRICLWDFSVGMLHRPRAVCLFFFCLFPWSVSFVSSLNGLPCLRK